MKAESSACLKTLAGESVPLLGVAARGRLSGLLLELTVEQQYRNDGRWPIETVYTFPLPATAVLLGFELDLGGRNYKAEAVVKAEAERRYEKAVDAGDSAALLTQNDEGLYTANLANLMPGETALVRYRYAEYLPAHRGVARLRIPTAITPRYGDPAAGGLEGAAVPTYDVSIEYPFSLQLDLQGVTDADSLRSPSHPVELQPHEGGVRLQLGAKGWLDRDFVLELQDVVSRNEVQLARDGSTHVAMLTCSAPPLKAVQKPLKLKLLVDCSGSMQGNSILAARQALLRGLEQLDPQDRVSLTTFGSHHEHLTDGLEPADEATLAPLRAVIRRIDANMGGTEMASAVAAVLKIKPEKGRRADVLLVTDGATHEVDEVIGTLAKSGQRLFVVMIGAAPNEVLARRITEETGGAYAFVASEADALQAIVRMFHQLREAPRRIAEVEWPATPLWTGPLPPAVFSDEPLRLYAGFAEAPAGMAQVILYDEEDLETRIAVPFATATVSGDLIPRMAAATRIPELNESSARELAQRHQLASKYTSFVLVAERKDGEKATTLPVVKAVPQMLPEFSVTLCQNVSYSRRQPDSASRRYSAGPPPALMQQLKSWATTVPGRSVTGEEFLQALLEEFELTGLLPKKVSALFQKFGEPAGYREVLARILRKLPAWQRRESVAIRVLVAALTRDPRFPMSDELRMTLEFDVFTRRSFRDARQVARSELGLG